MLLGIGGVRPIRAWTRLTGDPEPEVFHTNEGHAGFLGVERIGELVAQGLSFDEAKEAVRAGTVFTTHTPVPPASTASRGSSPLLRLRSRRRRGGQGPAGRAILELGDEADPSVFNMAHMGLRMAQRRNGVAQLHGIVSRGMFADLWPGFDSSEVPISSVTNGVHAPTWVAREVFDLAERGASRTADGRGERQGGADLGGHRPGRRHDHLGDPPRPARAPRRGGAAPAQGVVAAARCHRGRARVDGERFDPDVLTIGFARRVPSYKRLTLMLRDPSGCGLLLDPERPCSWSSPARRTPPTTAARSSCSTSSASPTSTTSGTASSSCPTTTSAWRATSTAAATSGSTTRCARSRPAARPA
jgi:starch phosphorylase